MFQFIKNASIPSICSKLTLLYVLNAMDIVFTFGLLKTGLFSEVNIVMVPIVENPILCILIKLILPALLIIYVLYHLHQSVFTDLKFCNFILNGVLCIYFLINVLHVIYTFMFIYIVIVS